jgi:cellulose synthase/poly-beta-1,6-N-acetylglucosamine synthase-like glycosyltransferase
MLIVVLRVLLHALAIVVFVNRVLGGFALRAFRGRHWDQTTEDFEPTVTVVIPMFNEGSAVVETLQSVLASDYPRDKLNVICVDDCSTDDTLAQARAVARFDPRVVVLRNEANVGKRCSINHAVRRSRSEIIISVDSDVVVDRGAIRALVRRFTSPRIAAVGGWVDVRNKHDNWLTRMQVLKYWYAYYVVKNVERAFRSVLAISGCLAAYRRSVLLELMPVLDERNILGVPIKYGEDRFLTRQIVKAGYQTTMTHDARCRTFVPSTLGAYFSQQLRWRRSNVVDYTGGLSHIWRLHPLVALNFFSLAIVLFLYPVGVVRATASGLILPAVLIHGAVLFGYGVYYRHRTRAWDSADRVDVLSYVPHALVMPITSALLVILALFTLDSSRWETRGASRGAVTPEQVAVPEELERAGRL